ncbi:MAG: cytochrome c biogenesis protein CcdA [Desulfobacterales bacterium]
MPDVSIYMAFAAGLISFLSPCVLPLVPGYISFISGVSFAEIRGKNSNTPILSKEKRIILYSSIFFIAGFSVVFILLGATATWIGTFIASKISILTKLAGVVVIFFGIYMMGFIRPRFLYKEARFQIKDKRFGYVGALLIGAAFAFGWTPCIGPILAGILTYAGTLEKVNQGVFLLLMYSLGLGIPFLVTAIGINQFWRFFNRIKKYMRFLEVTSGAIMVILGFMIFTNKLVLIPAYLPFLNKFAW